MAKNKFQTVVQKAEKNPNKTVHSSLREPAAHNMTISGNRISKCKEVQKIVEAALASKLWAIKFEGCKKHKKLIHIPTQHTVGIPGSPSDHRGWKAFKTTIKHIETGVQNWGQPR